MSLKIIVCILFSLFTFTSNAAVRNKTYEEYIIKHLPLAQKNMKQYGIPVSITLSQAILESAGGTSTLARQANNHFGIKVKSDWRGPYVLRNDDAPNERFCKYRNVEESYHHHGEFLQRPYYTSLFEIKTHDYKGWARGLQRAGYATNPAYANSLIRIIEDYELYKYDRAGGTSSSKKKPSKEERPIYIANGLLYVIAKSDDTLESIAKEMDFRVRSLVSYNELPENYRVQSGDVMYLEKKGRKTKSKNYVHIVKAGDSMYSISQLYGIRLKYLYKLNKKTPEYVPTKGDTLKLR